MPIPKVSWNPDQYLKFGDQRLRPAQDLLARVDLELPRIIYDLGCGTGNTTQLLIDRCLTLRLPELIHPRRCLKRRETVVPN